MNTSDLAKRLADKLIEQLKAGTAPWQQPVQRVLRRLLSLLLHRAVLRIARSRQNAFGAALFTLESDPRREIA
jgi:antirestriction protein ArdC